ncbi:MAG: PrsW family intramembrane metalloprotease [Candidatus Riflebacteria bacterium]|nr:PrsW family intramembrane metalloprotease [Candidatus Riflebacteria bacterium]
MSLFILAFAPGVFLCVYVYFRDRYERENPFTVLRTFLWGMAVVAPAIVVEAVLVPGAANLDKASLAARATAFFLVIGPLEELLKFAVVYLRVYPTAEFNEPMDGIVYSTASAMGFASLENLLYVWQEGPHAAFLRAFLAVPGHLFFSGVWGYHLGMTFRHRGEKGRVFGSLLLASLLHGGYDFVVVSQTPFALLVVPLMVIMGVIFLREIDLALDRSPMKPSEPEPDRGPEGVVTCPGCGAPTSARGTTCQHCGLLLPPEGYDESGH